MALSVEGCIHGAGLGRKSFRQGDGFDSGQTTDFLQKLLPECRAFGCMAGDACGNNVFGLEAKRHCLEPPQAFEQQGGPGHEDQGQGEFDDN